MSAAIRYLIVGLLLIAALLALCVMVVFIVMAHAETAEVRLSEAALGAIVMFALAALAAERALKLMPAKAAGAVSDTSSGPTVAVEQWRGYAGLARREVSVGRIDQTLWDAVALEVKHTEVEQAGGRNGDDSEINDGTIELLYLKRRAEELENILAQEQRELTAKREELEPHVHKASVGPWIMIVVTLAPAVLAGVSTFLQPTSPDGLHAALIGQTLIYLLLGAVLAVLTHYLLGRHSVRYRARVQLRPIEQALQSIENALAGRSDVLVKPFLKRR